MTNVGDNAMQILTDELITVLQSLPHFLKSPFPGSTNALGGAGLNVFLT